MPACGVEAPQAATPTAVGQSKKQRPPFLILVEAPFALENPAPTCPTSKDRHCRVRRQSLARGIALHLRHASQRPIT